MASGFNVLYPTATSCIGFPFQSMTGKEEVASLRLNIHVGGLAPNQFYLLLHGTWSWLA